MKKLLLTLTLVCLLLCGCTAPAPDTPEEPTPPEHAPFYLPDVAVDEVILYFNEVCLDAEISTSGDASVLQKWEDPIYYTVEGTPTDKDRSVLRDFSLWLNTVDYFPGIFEAKEGDTANLAIHFCSAGEMESIMGDWAAGLDGAVTFWYADDRIYDATICCRTDIAQETRNSVILEEIYNGLGPVQDTQLRTDSIAYAQFSTPQSLSAIDELILALLYHPDLDPGMDAAECEAVIRQLYY